MFLYGTLKRNTPDSFEISEYLAQKPIRKATIAGELYLIQSCNATCFPALMIKNINDEIVQGEVISFEENEIITILDQIEGEGHMYKRVKVIATYEDGTSEDVWAYVWMNDNSSLLEYKIQHGDFQVYGYQEVESKAYRKGYPLTDPTLPGGYDVFIERQDSFCVVHIPGQEKQ